MPPKNNNRAWGHDFFLEHPSASLIPKVPDAYADDKLTRKKVICKLCFQSHVAEEFRRDEADVQAGTRSIVRDQRTIEESCMQSNSLPKSLTLI